MLRNLLFASILIGTACAIHLQYLDIDSSEEEHAESVGAISTTEDLSMPKLPGICWGCQWAMDHVKKSIKNDKHMNTIKTKLKSICNKIGFIKDKCHDMVKKYMDILVEELSTSDDSKTICRNIGVCKKSMMEFFQDFPTVQQNL